MVIFKLSFLPSLLFMGVSVAVLKYISTSPFLAFFLALDALGCKPQHQCGFGERTCLVLTLFSNWDSESVITTEPNATPV